MAATQHKPGSLLGSLLGLLGFSAVAGVLVAATLTPAVAVATSATNSGLDLFESLPSYAQIDQQAERNRIYAQRDGQPVEIAQFYSQDRQILEWQSVPQTAIDALIAGEDRRFYDHGGVDGPSVLRAAMSQLGVGSGSGASTLTMQLVRQQIAIDACLAEGEDARAVCDAQYSESYQRKLAEMRLSIGLEQRYTKNEILLAYLNIANFGGNIYGIESGAQRLFNKPAAELSVAEAASLIATVQNPSTRRLDNSDNWPRNQERRDTIINRMAAEGFITEQERDEALAIPVNDEFVDVQPAPNGCIAGYDSARFFCDYVQRVLSTDTINDNHILGATYEDNQAALFEGGLQIYTSLDLDLNDAVQAIVDTNVPNNETRWQSGGAVTQLEVSTGRILTMVQNKDYDPRTDGPPTGTSVNFNVDYQHGTSGGFQPGSGFKIFTLAEWIDSGRSVNEQVDSSVEEWTNGEFTATCDPGATSIGSWEPQNNEGNEYSRMTPTQIMVNSVNTGTLRMASEVDLCNIMEKAEAMGIERADGGELTPFPSAVIGGSWNVTPMGMAEAFATISNGGVHCEPTAIDRIVSRDGSEIAPPPQDCETALRPEVASVMQHVLTQVTTGNPKNNPAGSTPVISKTGTTNGVIQTWVNGASPTVSTAVWVGNIVGNESLQARWDVRSVVFTQAMEAAIARYPGGQFLSPDQETLVGNAVPLPDVTGQPIADAQATLEAAGFQVQVADPVEGIQPSGNVEYTAPGPGTQVTNETPIVVYPSSGALAPEAAAETPAPSDAPADPAQADPAAQTWPNLVTQPVTGINATLEAAGFDPSLVQVTWQDHGEPNLCTVLAQNPLPDTPGAAGDPISVVVGTNAAGGDPGC